MSENANGLGAKGAFDMMREREQHEAQHGTTSTPMPRYQCHKKVWALKIATVHLDSDAAKEDGNRETDGTAIIVPESPYFAPFRVDADYVRKHKPQAGGYYVVYDDGYKSWSPAAAFEEGYSLIGR